jgi:hypothetical protein
MNAEIDIAGIFIPSALALVVIAFAATILVREMLAVFGIYRKIPYAPLFDLAIFLLSWSALAGLAERV